MPEQSPSSSPSPPVAHYIVVGEGVRDYDWIHTSSAPLSYSNLSASQQHFQLLQIPPSPVNAIVPVVRIFAAEAKYAYVTKSPTSSHTPQITSLTSAHISPSPSVAASAPSGHLSAPKQPPAVLGNHGLSASIPTPHAAPRRFSRFASRTIARPASQPIAPSSPSPPILNAAHDPVSPTPFTKKMDGIHRSGPTRTSRLPEHSAANPTNIPARKQLSRSTPASDQVRHGKSSPRVDLRSPTNGAGEQLIADLHPASSGTEVRSIDARSLKKSMSDNLASNAQAAALSDILKKDRKKLYPPVKLLPPFSSDPAVHALRAARVHSPNQSPARQRKDFYKDSAAVSTPANIALENAATGVPVTEGRLSSTRTPRPRGSSSVIPQGISGLSRGDQEHVETTQAALSRREVSGKDASTANADGHMPIEKRLRQAHCAQASDVSAEARIKQEGTRALSTANIDIVISSTMGSSQGIMEHEASPSHGRNGSAWTPGQTSATTAREKYFPGDPEPANTTRHTRTVEAVREGQTNLNLCPKLRANEIAANSRITENRQPAPSPTSMAVSPLWKTQISCASRIPHPDENCVIVCSEARSHDDKEPKVARPRKATLTSLCQGLAKSGTTPRDAAGAQCPVKNVFEGCGESHLRTASTLRPRLGTKGIECCGLMKEPFVLCVKLLVRSLCASGSGSGINKEAAARFRRELRNILKRPKGPQLVDGEKITVQETNAVLQNQSVIFGGDNKTGMYSSIKLVRSPSSGMNELSQGNESHEGILSSTEKSPGQILPSGTFPNKVSPKRSLQTTSQPQKPETSSDSTFSRSEARASNSSAISGIRFTFIQWGLSVLKKDACVEEIVRGAAEILKTCNSLKSPLPKSPSIQDEELLGHVLNLDAAATTIHYLLSQIDSLTQETPVGVSKKPRAVKNWEQTLNALRDILVWVRYLIDRVFDLWSKYRQGSIQTSEVKSFCQGMERFMKSSYKKDGFLSALRDCKKYFPHSKSVADGKEDGKPFYDRRRTLGREARSLFRMFGKVCSWCLKQLPTLPTDASPAQGTDESVKKVTAVPPKHVNEVGRKRRSEKAKDVEKEAASIKASANGADVSRFAADARMRRENQSPPTRRSSVHDPTVPVKRKREDMSDTSLRKSKVESGIRDGLRTPIPRKRRQAKNAPEGTPDSNTSVGRRQGKSSGRKGFHPKPMAVLKSTRGGSNKHVRKDDLGPSSGRPKHTAITPSSSAMQGQSVAHLRSKLVPTGNQAEETIGPPLKRRRNQDRVSFSSRLVEGQRDSNIRKEENASLYDDGYDLLGRENSIQESAIRERTNQLSRGSVRALFGCLRAEVLQRKNESEGRTSPIPKYLNLKYPPAAAKQLRRHLESPP